MADSEEVLKELDPPDDVEIIGIVVNEKGAQRAINTNSVRTSGISPTRFHQHFLRNNQRQTLDEAIDELEKIKDKGDDAGLDIGRLYVDGFRKPLRRSMERGAKSSTQSICSNRMAYT